MSKFRFEKMSMTVLQKHFNIYHRTTICIFECVNGLILVVKYESILQAMLHGAYF